MNTSHDIRSDGITGSCLGNTEVCHLDFAFLGDNNILRLDIPMDKNIITRAVGAEDKVEPDFFTVELQEGEIVLMCSDGLTNMLEDEEIRMIISGARDLVEKAESLVEAANANGGRDNISVILIEPCA